MLCRENPDADSLLLYRAVDSISCLNKWVRGYIFPVQQEFFKYFLSF